jgi:putative transposase
MPGRLVPLVNENYYHVVNRGIAEIPAFQNRWNYKRFVSYLSYYQNIDVPGRFSFFLQLSKNERIKILSEMKKEKHFYVDIIAYCLMPTHFHLLLKQTVDNGISIFMSKITNSYTRYFNVKNGRKGSLFQGNFKAVKIDNENQLLHVSRYIHLNPYSSGIIKSLSEIDKYDHSSLSEYLHLNGNMCQKNVILSYFNKSYSYKDYVFDRAEYQKELEFIKHLVLE